MRHPVSSWSARRAAVAAEAEAEKQAAQEEIIAQERARLAERSDEDILEELGLPDPDNLTMGDDFKAFMSKAVPEHLRNRALRKLWRSNPVLACVDGLNDYDDDFLTGSVGQGAIKTTYQVGKGMLSHLLEIERQKNPPMDAEPLEISQVEEALSDSDDANETDASAIVVETAPEADLDPAPRRMQFQFEDDIA